jgi:hypothetical protein
MWDCVSDKESDLIWIKDALIAGTAIFLTDGSFGPCADATVNGAGWIINFTTVRRTLEGSFYKCSSSASSSCGELLGLIAIHTLIMALCKYYAMPQVTDTICCDSKSALNKSSQKSKTYLSKI